MASTKFEKPVPEKLLKWIHHLDRLSFSWHNKMKPGPSFKETSDEIQAYLEKLLLEDLQ